MLCLCQVFVHFCLIAFCNHGSILVTYYYYVQEPAEQSLKFFKSYLDGVKGLSKQLLSHEMFFSLYQITEHIQYYTVHVSPTKP